MFWWLLIQTDLCHQWKFFWGHSYCKMVKMCHQTHIHTSHDPLTLSANPYLATTGSEEGSNDCYLQEPGKTSSLCLLQMHFFLFKYNQGTNNLISEIKTSHQIFVDWSSCIFWAAIKDNSNLVGFGWMVHSMVRQILYFSIMWCIFGNLSIPFNKNFFHKFLVVIKILWILFKSLLKVLGSSLYHLSIIWQLHNRVSQQQSSLIVITHFYCLFIHKLQKFIVPIWDVF